MAFQEENLFITLVVGVPLQEEEDGEELAAEEEATTLIKI